MGSGVFSSPALVVVDAAEGSLARYQTGGQRPVLTHACTIGHAASFSPEIIEEFRTNPHPDFYVGRHPPPTPPTSGSPVATQIPRAA